MIRLHNLQPRRAEVCLLLCRLVAGGDPPALHLLNQLLPRLNRALLMEGLQHRMERRAEAVARPRAQIEPPDLVDIQVAVLDRALQVRRDARRAERGLAILDFGLWVDCYRFTVVMSGYRSPAAACLGA